MKKILIVFSLLLLTACSSTDEKKMDNANIQEQYVELSEYNDEHASSAEKAFEEITINDMHNAPLINETKEETYRLEAEEETSTKENSVDDTTEILAQDEILEQNLTETIDPSDKEVVLDIVTISINCITALDRDINDKILSLLPVNGLILSQTEVEIKDNDTVFDILLKVCKEQNIQIEYVKSPVYGSSYIESIGHLYEFDAGSLSGWTYRINGEFPNISSSSISVKNGDKIEFLYTCDLGEDVKNV